MYNDERIKQIMDNFTQLLMDADNSGTLSVDKSGLGDDEYHKLILKDARQYWSRLRADGSDMLGLTRFLLDQLSAKSADDK